MKVKREDVDLDLNPEMVVQAFKDGGFKGMNCTAVHNGRNEFLWFDRAEGKYGVNGLIVNQQADGTLVADIAGDPIYEWDANLAPGKPESWDVDQFLLKNQLRYFLMCTYSGYAEKYDVLGIHQATQTFLEYEPAAGILAHRRYILLNGIIEIIGLPIATWYERTGSE